MVSTKAKYKVVIVGGGVGGLSAAHELAERGFEVHVFERRRYYGGKAASVTIGGSENEPSEATTGPDHLPGEHGFRFFPGWYRHLPDTMKRIPYKDRTVHDNLVPADVNLLVAYDRDPVRAVVRLPTTMAELKTAMNMPAELMRLGLTMDDMQFFFMKLWSFLTSSEERRIQEFDSITWWEFMDADNRSQPFRDYLVVSATRNTVAAKPREASAYSIAKIAIQTLFDTLTPQTLFDRVLNGPTNMVWINPWKDYLTGLGVKFHDDCELDAINLEDGRIVSLQFAHTQEARSARTVAEYFEQVCALWSDFERAFRKEHDLPEETDRASQDGPAGLSPHEGKIEKILVDCCGQLASGFENFDEDWSKTRGGYWCLHGVQQLRQAWPKSHPKALDALRALIVSGEIDAPGTLGYITRRKNAIAKAMNAAARSASAVMLRTEQFRARPETGDYFIFALPVEQMAYYINRSETLQRIDPSLQNIILLSDHVDWMAGIQFFLKSTVNVTRGHIDLLNSEWALTAISEVQFWKDIDFIRKDWGEVRSILSVDISAWDRKGRFLRKEAFNCTREEVAEEVWSQLKQALNRPGRIPVLSDEMLLGGGPRDKRSFYLDDSIIDRFDRKKQAVYDKFRGVRFSAAELLRKQSHKGAAAEISFMYGQPLQLNAEPLLVNRVGSLRLRPTAKTGVSNMFLAADYVDTNTHLATMEGANEAARAAVNEILLASGVREEPCAIWPLWEPGEIVRRFDELMFRRGMKFQDTYADIPLRMAAGAASMASQFATKAMGKMFNRMK